jgi:hypothetical protein
MILSDDELNIKPVEQDKTCKVTTFEKKITPLTDFIDNDTGSCDGVNDDDDDDDDDDDELDIILWMNLQKQLLKKTEAFN